MKKNKLPQWVINHFEPNKEILQSISSHYDNLGFTNTRIFTVSALIAYIVFFIALFFAFSIYNALFALCLIFIVVVLSPILFTALMSYGCAVTIVLELLFGAVFKKKKFAYVISFVSAIILTFLLMILVFMNYEG